MSNLQAENGAISKILIPVIVLAVALFIPRWYWTEMEYELATSSESQKNTAEEENGAQQPAVSPAPRWILNQDNSAGKQENRRKYEPPKWYGPFRDSVTLQWLLVTVGIATALAVIWQARETKASVKIQEAGLKQWIILKSWNSTAMSAPTWKTGILDLTFFVSNETNFPLTVNRILVAYGNQPDPMEPAGVWEDHVLTQDIFLAPRGQQPYEANFLFDITRDQAEIMTSDMVKYGGIGAEMHITVEYTDVSGNKVPEVFQGFLFCSRQETVFRRSNPQRLETSSRKRQEHDRQ